MIVKVRHLISLPLFMAALSQALPGYAQWVSTGGPLGGLGYDVRIHPQNRTTLYVTDNYAGVVLSTDGGATWRASNQGITVRSGPTGNAFPIFSLTVDPNNPNILWAGTNGAGGQYGVFKSTDGGATWSLKTSGIPSAPYGIVFRGFTVQAGSSDTVYAMAELPSTVQGREFNRVHGQVFKTTDGGQSWNLLWQGDNLARYLIIDPTDNKTLYLSTGIFDREAYNSDCANAIPGGVGVLKSSDGGATWTPINSGLTNLYVGSLRMHPTNRLLLFAAAGNNACSAFYANNQQGGLFRTADGGASWSKVIANDILTTVNFAPANPDIVYAGSAGAFYRSSDGGFNWTKYKKPDGSSWGPAGVRAGVPIDVTVDPADVNLLYANNYGGGVFRSGDGAKTWTIWSKGYSGAQIHAVHIPAASASSVLAIGRSGPFRSTNFGGDWTGISTGQADFGEWNTLTTDPRKADVILMADEHQGKIMRSTNAGASFVIVFTHPQTNAGNIATRQGFRTFAVSPSNPDVVYAGLARERNSLEQDGTPAGRVLYKSTDGGQSFVAAGSALDGKNVLKLVVHPSQSDTVWAATSGGAFMSSDGGENWSLLGLGGRNITALAVDIAHNTLVAGEKNAGIWTSENGGGTWSGPSRVGFNNANPYVKALSFKDSGTLYAADYYSGAYSSTDHGRTWSPFPDTSMSGLSVRAAKDIVAGNGLVYLATDGGGVFRYETPPATTNTAMVQGWNLLGNSVNSALDVATTFSDAGKISTVWKWVPASGNWAFYTPLQTDGGAAYAAANGYSVLTSINGGEGFWVNAKLPFTVSLPTGTAITSSSFRSMNSGWNLIAIGDNNTPRAFNNALSATPPAVGQIPLNLSTLWAWDTTQQKWYFYAPDLDASGSLSNYIIGKGYLDFGPTKTLDRTTGFWVNKP
ncbi:MAG: hypothetical protein NTY41_18785 [Proteobacteria bacterium]|nr:hypothetical protein [Pseudomonadota bacterium]